jgi:Ca-activated chloride channel family protein
MYSEKSRFPWSIFVVLAAVGLFGCIILVAVLGPRLLNRNSQVAANPDATEAPPPGSVSVDISSSNTKEDWMNAVVEQFNQEQHKTSSGQVIFVRVGHVTSGGSQQAILDGKSQPTVWSPGDQSWIDGANQVWRDRKGRPLVSEACPATVLAPIGFAMWRPMAEALGWPDKPISWQTLADLSANPDGWTSLGHSEWGQFKFGHTHPDFSNTGLLMLASLAYSVNGQTSGLKAEQVYSDKVEEAFRRVEQNTYHYGIQNRPLMQLLAQRGPSYLHAVTSSEAETLKTNADYGSSMRFPLVFIFPSAGTYWSEQPYCILETDWVSDEQRQAAEVFRDYLIADAQQAKAIDYYLRPVLDNIPLHAPLALDYGTDPRVTRSSVPALESPSAEVASAVKDVFHKTKKKATVLLVLDTSGSMEGEKIKNAVASSVNFVQRLDPNDKIYALGFGGEEGVYDLGGGRAGDVGETLVSQLNGLFAQGNTPLYDAVCQAAETVSKLQAEDTSSNERRLYGIVLLSDGDDTSSVRTENQMFSCLPSGEDVEGVKVFTIAYGEDANTDLMLRIANRTNGKTFTGDPESIEQIYNAISAEQ